MPYDVPPGQRRPIALQFLPALYAADPVGSHALDWLREQGLGYREGVFYADWRSLAEAEPVIEVIHGPAPPEYPSADAFREVPWDLQTPFQVCFRVETDLSLVGLEDPMYFAHNYDGWLSVEELEDRFQQELDAWFSEYTDARMVSFEITEFRHREGAPWPASGEGIY